jgi:hypothetical protein
MAGDYTRFTFDPRRRYSGVWMQQGRVQLDADWNEAVEIVKHGVRTLALDTFGRVGVPALTTPDAFLIGVLGGAPADLSIQPGRLYLDGFLAEIFADEVVTYLTQPFLPDAPPLPAGDVVVYLDLWEREITSVQDLTLLDVALGGADTATRTQTVWQVRVEARPGAQCGMPVGAPPSAGRLTTAAIAPPAPDDPCILPPLAGYRGLENRLYRVEIHEGGALGTARFTWSRDNGSIVSAVSEMAVAGGETILSVDRIGRDPVLRFRIDDWVTVTDDHRELHGEAGEMARVIDVDEAQRRLVLDRALPTGGGRAFGPDAGEIVARHTRVQRWDQTATTNTIDADGLILTAAGPIDLEDGVQVSFETDPAGGDFRTGDYWVFAARTADASVEILDRARPRGIEHHYVQLAAITGLGGQAPEPTDCRPRPEDGRLECCCCLVTVGPREDQRADFTTLAAAIGALGNLAPDASRAVIVCLLEGDHVIVDPVRVTRPRVTIRGCGPGTRLLPRQGPALVLEGPEQALEDVWILAEQQAPLVQVLGDQKRIERCRLENQASGPAVLAQRALDLVIARNIVQATGGLDLTGERMEIVENRVSRGPVRVQPSSDTVRIRDNDLASAVQDAVVLGGQGLVYEIDVEHNRIRGALRHGIAGGFFDPEDQGGDGIVAGLRIVGNEIRDCIDARTVRQPLDPPFSAIALGRVYDLIVRDNRIEGNGTEATGPVCGLYVRHSRGVDISRNLLRDNGRRPDGQRFDGPQAGIRLEDARVSLVALQEPDSPRSVVEVDVLPAARIAGNHVQSRRGPALHVRGQGAMAVEENRFEAFDVLGDLRDTSFATLDQFVGTVFLFNSGLPGYLAGFLAGAGVSALTPGGPSGISGTPLATALTVGGQTRFLGNQARLDLARSTSDVALANVLVVSLDDTVIAANQTEGVLAARIGRTSTDAVATLPTQFVGDLLFADLLNVGLTTRQTDNGLMSTPLLTMFSIISLGLVNHCTDNQTTSCILALGLSSQSVVRDNAVLFPHPIFCPQDD